MSFAGENEPYVRVYAKPFEEIKYCYRFMLTETPSRSGMIVVVSWGWE